MARRHTLAAIESLRVLGDRMRPVLHVCEIRTVAADGLWMSPEFGRETTGFHFTWKPEPAAVEEVLVEVEAALSLRSRRDRTGASSSWLMPLPSRRSTNANPTSSACSSGSIRAAHSATPG